MGPASAAFAMHPTETHAIQFAAEADLDEPDQPNRMRVLSCQNCETEAATGVDVPMGSRGNGRPLYEDAALRGNVVVGFGGVDEFSKALGRQVSKACSCTGRLGDILFE